MSLQCSLAAPLVVTIIEVCRCRSGRERDSLGLLGRATRRLRDPTLFHGSSGAQQTRRQCRSGSPTRAAVRHRRSVQPRRRFTVDAPRILRDRQWLHAILRRDNDDCVRVRNVDAQLRDLSWRQRPDRRGLCAAERSHDRRGRLVSRLDRPHLHPARPLHARLGEPRARQLSGGHRRAKQSRAPRQPTRSCAQQHVARPDDGRRVEVAY